MRDTAKLRALLPDGTYTPLGALAKEDDDGVTELFESQEFLIKRAQKKRLEAAEEEARRAAERDHNKMRAKGNGAKGSGKTDATNAAAGIGGILRGLRTRLKR